MVNCTVNGVVHANIKIIRIGGEFSFVKLGNIGKGFVSRGSNRFYIAVFLRFGKCFLCPLTCNDIVRFAAAVHKVQRNCRKLCGSAAL